MSSSSTIKNRQIGIIASCVGQIWQNAKEDYSELPRPYGRGFLIRRLPNGSLQRHKFVTGVIFEKPYKGSTEFRLDALFIERKWMEKSSL